MLKVRERVLKQKTNGHTCLYLKTILAVGVVRPKGK